MLQRDGVEQGKAGGVGSTGHCEESAGLPEEQREAAAALSGASLILAARGWASGPRPGKAAPWQPPP